MIREMFSEFPLVTTFTLASAAGFLFIILDGLLAKPSHRFGTVVDKHYVAESNRVGVDSGVSSDGQVVTVTTRSIEPEKFMLIVKADYGDVFAIKCQHELYYEKESGDDIQFVIYKGYFTGIDWSFNVIK
jgi:hypothetical protein